MCQISHVLNRTGLVVCSIFSRKGARIARNFNVFFVFSPNAFAYFVPRRDFIYFSLAKAPRSPRTSMFLLCLPQTPLRTLRLGESIFFFSRRGAEAAVSFNVWFVFAPNTFAYFAPWREYICFFLSQKRRARREFQCFVLTPNTFACFAPWRE